MIRSLYYSQDGKLKTDLGPDETNAALTDSGGTLWYDFQGAPNSEAEPILRDTFHFHPLAIDDALQESHVPKLDNWETFLYIVLHAVIFDAQDNDVHTIELDVFLGSNYIVTHHDDPVESLDKVWATVGREGRFIKNGPDHLLYRIVDEIAASFMPVVEQLDLTIDHLEDDIFSDHGRDILGSIFSIKRSILYLRRILAHQREVLNKLARDDYEVIDAADRIYFRDVYDHMVRMYDISEGIRDLISGTLDTYLSALNNRLNDVMKTLTVITTFFMPITFITGFFGMNFFQQGSRVENWIHYPAFIVTLLVIVLTPLGMYFWMRRRHWM